MNPHIPFIADYYAVYNLTLMPEFPGSPEITALFVHTAPDENGYGGHGDMYALARRRNDLPSRCELFGLENVSIHFSLCSSMTLAGHVEKCRYDNSRWAEFLLNVEKRNGASFIALYDPKSSDPPPCFGLLRQFAISSSKDWVGSTAIPALRKFHVLKNLINR